MSVSARRDRRGQQRTCPPNSAKYTVSPDTATPHGKESEALAAGPSSDCCAEVLPADVNTSHVFAGRASLNLCSGVGVGNGATLCSSIAAAATKASVLINPLKLERALHG